MTVRVVSIHTRRRLRVAKPPYNVNRKIIFYPCQLLVLDRKMINPRLSKGMVDIFILPWMLQLHPQYDHECGYSPISFTSDKALVRQLKFPIPRNTPV